MMFIEKNCSIVVVNGIKIPGTHYQDQKYCDENILTMTKLMKK
jgi:hypothetical protein